VSSEFVRYDPEIETIDLHLDETLAQIIDFVETKGRESPRTEGAGRAVRAAHAKSFGLVKAEVERYCPTCRRVRAGHLCQTGPPRRRDSLLQHINVLRGGEYFFMPSLSALNWIGGLHPPSGSLKRAPALQ